MNGNGNNPMDDRSGENVDAPRALHCYAAERSDTGVWLSVEDRVQISVARQLAVDMMVSLGMDPEDFKTRDKIIMAISPRVEGVLDHVNDSIYRRAMESMAAQMVHPKMTAQEMATMQLGESE